MKNLFLSSLDLLTEMLARFEASVPAPERIEVGEQFRYAYKEQRIDQAVVSKFSRVVSGLRSAEILLEKGMLQEQQVMQRVLDELCEDIRFLSYAEITQELTERHQQYLTAFFSEELPMVGEVKRLNRKSYPARGKIQAYLVEQDANESNPSLAIDISHNISVVFSGFVHAAATNIMESYAGDPPRFQVNGMCEPAMIADAAQGLCNNFFRGLHAARMIAFVLDDSTAEHYIQRFMNHFSETTGVAPPSDT